MYKNIVLIGMPGSGKSTIGLELSKISGLDIIDIDAEIIKNLKMSIAEIFARFGEAKFRELESSEIKKAAEKTGFIIVTGGGAVKNFKNCEFLRKNGRIYHIERDINLLEREGRPLSMSGDLEKMYRERLPLYKKFRDVAILNNRKPQDAALEILNDFKKF